MILPAGRPSPHAVIRISRWGAAASLLCLGLFHLSCDSVRSTAGILQPGKPVERRLDPAVRHVYPLTLQAGHYFSVRVDQPEIDVAASLSGPEGATVATSNDPDGRLQPERISLVAPVTGEYRLTVAPQDPRARSGSYRIELLELRPGRPQDGKKAAAEVAFAEGRRLQRLEDGKSLRQALSRFSAARDLWRDAGDRSGEVRALNGMALVEYLLSQFDVARTWAEEALRIAEQSRDRIGSATALSLLGDICTAEMALPQGLKLQERALTLWRELRNPAGEGRALNGLGVMHLLQGDDVLAERELQAARRLLHTAGDVESEANTLTAIQGVYYKRGEIDQASRYVEEALGLSRPAGRLTAEASALYNLARIEKLRGDLETALKRFEENLAIHRRLGARDHELAALQALGSVYNDLGDYEKGLENYRQGLKISRQLKLPGTEARLLNHMGWTLHSQGDPRAAIERYGEALAITGKLENAESTTALVLHNLGVAKMALGRSGEGLPDLERALALRRVKGSLAEQALTLREIGTAYTHLQKPQQAAESFAQALKLGQQIGSPGLTAECLYRWALLERDQARLNEALKKVMETIEIVESVRSRMASETLRTSFFGSKRAYYELYVDLLMRLNALRPGRGYEAEALSASERARARGLLELLARRIDVRHGLSAALKQRETELGSRMSWILEELRGSGSSQGARGRELRSQLAAAEGEMRSLEEEIRAEYPHYAEVRYPTPLGLNEIRRLLKGDDALLQYFLGKERSFLFVVTRERLASHVLPGADAITERVRTLRGLLDRPNPLSVRRYCQDAAELYDVLLRPAAGMVAGKRHLLISPDGPLYFLPFEALLTGGTAGCERPYYAELPYLLREHAVSYVPSVSVLSSLRGPQPSKPAGGGIPMRFVAFADPSYGPGPAPASPRRAGALQGRQGELPPLPNSRREVEEVARFYPGGVKLYLGREATEGNVKRNPFLGSAWRIHFATHGQVNEVRPELSALVLTPGQGEDGYLHVDEIFNLELNADLLVLSACDSGLGRQVNGEGVLGLTRAFHYAGAKSVVVSLWPVLDAGAPELMKSFYRHLDVLRDKAEALRVSKLGMIRAGQANPSYWAPFILAGDPK